MKTFVNKMINRNILQNAIYILVFRVIMAEMFTDFQQEVNQKVKNGKKTPAICLLLIDKSVNISGIPRYRSTAKTKM